VSDAVQALLAGPAQAGMVLLALWIDALTGEPAWLYRRLPHPVVLIGVGVGRLDRHLNRDEHGARRRRAAGILAVLVLVGGAVGLGTVLHGLFAALPGGWVIEGLFGSTLLAQRSLLAHVAAVGSAMETGGLDAGRRSVALIVGRDPNSLDEAAVARAAIESGAENFSDGIVAPAFWYLLFGLPGLLAYKTINTADSMIGHCTPRHQAFGWAAARLDDLVNLPAARLSAGLLCLAAGSFAKMRLVWRCVWRDAARHRSPNAGWPEAAMAGALGLALAGPRRYGRDLVADAWMNPAGRRQATATDIAAAVHLIGVACGVGWSLVGLVWALQQFVR